MKKPGIICSLILIVFNCLGQSIDTAALHILQRSYDRLASMGTVTYRMTWVDSMIRENHLNVRSQTISAAIKKDEYWHILFDNKSNWLIRRDTLYKKEAFGTGPITFTTNWNSHDLAANSIYNILGTGRPALRNDIASLLFVQDTSNSEFYVIDIIRKKIDNGTHEIQSKIYFNRYWVDRKSFLPLRRIMYSKRSESGKEAIDIYDFSVSLESDDQIFFNPVTFFDAPVIKESEKNSYETIGIGTIAPPLKATDVRTGKAVSISDLKGKVVLLDFWYLSCMPCRILMPKLQKLQVKLRNKNFVVVGINVRDTSSKKIIQFLDNMNIRQTNYYKTGQLTRDYKLQAFPTTMVLDRDGKVILVEIGTDENTEIKLEKAIMNALEAYTGSN